MTWREIIDAAAKVKWQLRRDGTVRRCGVALRVCPLGYVRGLCLPAPRCQDERLVIQAADKSYSVGNDASKIVRRYMLAAFGLEEKSDG